VIERFRWPVYSCLEQYVTSRHFNAFSDTIFRRRPGALFALVPRFGVNWWMPRVWRCDWHRYENVNLMGIAVFYCDNTAYYYSRPTEAAGQMNSVLDLQTPCSSSLLLRTQYSTVSRQATSLADPCTDNGYGLQTNGTIWCTATYGRIKLEWPYCRD